MKQLKLVIVAVSVLSPLFSFAQLYETRNILETGKFLITDLVIPIVFVLALLLFFWGVVKYIYSVGSEKEGGKKIMVWGVVALFVMSSVWGLVRLLRTELNIDEQPTIIVPNITDR